MHIFYSDAHYQHNPPFEILEGGERTDYFESPQRMERILNAVRATTWAEIHAPTDFGMEPLRAVHTADYLDYLQIGYAAWQKEGGQLRDQPAAPMLVGATFPMRRMRGKPRVMAGLSGYYSLDTSCPIVAGTFEAARQSVNCALSGAQALANGEQVAFALCRPPGHHAGRDYGGGYCYLNNAAIAAQWLTQFGRVAVLDVDYHGGNGTQDIFYESAEVLTISLHADPARQYPFFMGYADETGAGAGRGLHRNFPLPAHVGDEAYLRLLDEALALIRDFAPRHLVISFGADTYEADPLGDLSITTSGFQHMGQQIALLNLPTLIVMEGGYNNEALGTNTVNFVEAFIRNPPSHTK